MKPLANRHRSLVLAAALTAAAVAAPHALATNGYSPTGFGTAN